MTTEAHQHGPAPDRLPSARDDAERGSLPMVMLVMLIGLALGAVLVPTVLVQSRSTVFTTNRQNALHAAQAGVDAAIGRIRATSADGGTADTTKLPCTTAGTPVSGPVAGAGAETFSAQIAYYVSDPVKSASATTMICVTGKGVYDSATGLSAPAYARITSVGTDGSGSGQGRTRTLVTTYAFQTTNANIAGGQIRIYPPNADPTTPRICMDAGVSPVAGTTVKMQTCSSSDPVAPSQVFAYRNDLTLQLTTAAVNTATYPNGLCLDTDVSSGAPVSGNPIVLKPCNASGNLPPYSQQWSDNDNTAYQASKANSRNDGDIGDPNNASTNALCMNVSSQTPGTVLKLAPCLGYGPGQDTQPTQSWIPAPTVGAGGAKYPQQVNFQEFGRCMDVPGGGVRLADEKNTWVHLYPCKQNPKPETVLFNSRFFYDDVKGWLYINHTFYLDNPQVVTKLCLYIPRNDDVPRMTKCDDPAWAAAGVTADQLSWRWTGSSPATPYSNRYRFEDPSTGSTRCLGIADPRPPIGNVWSILVMASCNGSKGQKWNADPRLGAPTVQDTVERPGPGN